MVSENLFNTIAIHIKARSKDFLISKLSVFFLSWRWIDIILDMLCILVVIIMHTHKNKTKKLINRLWIFQNWTHMKQLRSSFDFFLAYECCTYFSLGFAEQSMTRKMSRWNLDIFLKAISCHLEIFFNEVVL